MHALIHAQHLSGVGHLVRGLELARALLAAGHRVTLVEGGRPVPRAPLPGELERLVLPVLRRRGDALQAAAPAPDVTLDELLAERRRRLTDFVRDEAPDVVVLEHFPFSKWALEDEFLALVTAARAARPNVRVVCSVRDVCAQTRKEAVPPDVWRGRVASLLAEHFDLLLVHADPRFTTLGAHFTPADPAPVEVVHTGFVSEPLPEAGGARDGPDGRDDGAPWDVLSTGGGGGEVDFPRRVIGAWRRVARANGGRLAVFPGAFLGDHERASLADACRGDDVELREFGPGFLATLARARLSIGRAGYNSATNLLATRRRALLVPDPRMSDQGPRARLFEQHGLAEVLSAEDPDEAGLAAALERAHARPEPRHDLDLDGARKSAAVLAAAVSGRAAR